MIEITPRMAMFIFADATTFLKKRGVIPTGSVRVKSDDNTVTLDCQTEGGHFNEVFKANFDLQKFLWSSTRTLEITEQEAIAILDNPKRFAYEFFTERCLDENCLHIVVKHVVENIDQYLGNGSKIDLRRIYKYGREFWFISGGNSVQFKIEENIFSKIFAAPYFEITEQNKTPWEIRVKISALSIDEVLFDFQEDWDSKRAGVRHIGLTDIEGAISGYARFWEIISMVMDNDIYIGEDLECLEEVERCLCVILNSNGLAEYLDDRKELWDKLIIRQRVHERDRQLHAEALYKYAEIENSNSEAEQYPALNKFVTLEEEDYYDYLEFVAREKQSALWDCEELKESMDYLEIAEMQGKTEEFLAAYAGIMDDQLAKIAANDYEYIHS